MDASSPPSLQASNILERPSTSQCEMVGCVIVNVENRTVGAGYNGMPNSLNDDKVPRGKSSDSPVETKYLIRLLFIISS
ncbi:hypothetical protein V5799_011926 [Amblyomma americanum]|uniref:CMP/dCMP-type deaminase domain-containing protein n=1 Tax=Amblyomma americanum TaxID=6943 RepID=A0AAQ4EFV4_AMBAM